MAKYTVRKWDGTPVARAFFTNGERYRFAYTICGYVTDDNGYIVVDHRIKPKLWAYPF